MKRHGAEGWGLRDDALRDGALAALEFVGYHIL